MKIGMVTAVYKPLVNGVTHMISLYKKHLEELGHEVTIFTLGDPDPQGEEPGVIRSPGKEVGSYGYYLSTRYTREAQERLREMEILHCHHMLMSVDMAHRYARCPIVYTNHTRYDLYAGTYTPLPRSATDVLMRQIWPEYTDLADVVITPSDSVRQVMLDFGVRRPIVVIENGVDLRPFHSPPKPYTKTDLNIPETAVLLVYVGRVSHEKNITVLLEQFAIAREIVPDLHLMVVGTGPAQDEVSTLIADLDIEDNVLITGGMAYADIPNILAAADIFVTASITEVHPLTVIEAMAAGLPVAATNSPGILDTVEPGKTGLLVSEPERGLAAAMVGLSVNAQKRARMSRAANISSNKYDINLTIKNTLDLYEELRYKRPDLEREKAHGRWYRDTSKLRPKIEQLANLIRSGNV